MLRHAAQALAPCRGALAGARSAARLRTHAPAAARGVAAGCASSAPVRGPSRACCAGLSVGALQTRRRAFGTLTVIDEDGDKFVLELKDGER